MKIPWVVFHTHQKSPHLGKFQEVIQVNGSRVRRRFDQLLCGLKSLFGSHLFTHDGASTSNKELDGFNNCLWHQQDSPMEACLAMASAHAVWLSLGGSSLPPTESECWKTETEIGTPARVEAETWKFARQRSSSRVLGTRGLYVLWNYYATNSHAATPALKQALFLLLSTL